jgi:hypothetical protein
MDGGSVGVAGAFTRLTGDYQSKSAFHASKGRKAEITARFPARSGTSNFSHSLQSDGYQVSFLENIFEVLGYQRLHKLLINRRNRQGLGQNQGCCVIVI